VRHHCGMPSDVHRDPDRLREHAAAAHELADVLQAALRSAPPLVHGEAMADIDVAVRRAVGELSDLAAALAAAAAVDRADADGAEALRRAAGRA
jgi:hypothetical protein